ncbi:MAG: hypothetical protein KDI68_15170 [Gammaproteobacteria bacterium]|nr:hypothetical protein [Gammaproteobacteria bacterium]
MEILGFKLYISDFSLVAYVILYLPLAWLLFKLLRRLIVRGLPDAYRGAGKVVLLLALLTLPYWDSFAISYQANRLCAAEGGLHVYDTAEVEGFYGDPSIEYWSKHGFRYVENYIKRDGKTLRYEMHQGEPREIESDVTLSRYSIYASTAPVSGRIERWEYYVAEISSGTKLGTLVFFKIKPGRFDKLAIGLSGFTFTPWFCGDTNPKYPREKLDLTDVVKKVLIPKTFQGEKSDGDKGTI